MWSDSQILGGLIPCSLIPDSWYLFLLPVAPSPPLPPTSPPTPPSLSPSPPPFPLPIRVHRIVWFYHYVEVINTHIHTHIHTHTHTAIQSLGEIQIDLVPTGLPPQEPLEIEDSHEQSRDPSRDRQTELRRDDDIITDDVIEQIVATATSGSSDEGEESSDGEAGTTVYGSKAPHQKQCRYERGSCKETT